MRRLHKSEAIVLKKRNIGETDQLITFFTKRFGKIMVKARGVRKLGSKRAASLDLFNHLIIFLYKKNNFYTLTEVKLKSSFDKLKQDLGSVSLAFQVGEVLDKLLAENQEQVKLFFKTVEFLNDYEFKKNGQEALLVFKQNLLSDLGFGLPQDKTTQSLDNYIESIIERKLLSSDFLT